MRRILRARPVPLAAAAIAATTLAWLVPGAAANASPHTRPAAPSPGQAAPPAHHAATRLNAPSDTGASDISNLGTNGWRVQSSATATQTGAQISTPGFNTSTWLPVTNDDAGAPGTEIEALAQNGQCPGDTALQPVNQNTGSPTRVGDRCAVQHDDAVPDRFTPAGDQQLGFDPFHGPQRASPPHQIRASATFAVLVPVSATSPGHLSARSPDVVALAC